MTDFHLPKGLKAIGEIRSPFKERCHCPPQGKCEPCEIIIFKDYVKGLDGIESFTHLHVVYWLHEFHEPHLTETTPWDSKPYGLFATRSPNRVNPFAYSVTELEKREGNKLFVKGLDALNGTPVLDIKPYVPRIDSKPSAGNGWLGKKFGRNQK
jgi:formylmethanofuran dehydrogenase subunit E